MEKLCTYTEIEKEIGRVLSIYAYRYEWYIDMHPVRQVLQDMQVIIENISNYSDEQEIMFSKNNCIQTVKLTQIEHIKMVQAYICPNNSIKILMIFRENNFSYCFLVHQSCNCSLKPHRFSRTRLIEDITGIEYVPETYENDDIILEVQSAAGAKIPTCQYYDIQTLSNITESKRSKEVDRTFALYFITKHPNSRYSKWYRAKKMRTA